jgi:3,4-dihydroxy-2-butanone 4-phosphate synthase
MKRPATTSDWLRDEATNQTRFRVVNESIEMTTDVLGLHEQQDVYVCECGDGECEAPIRLTRAEYESVRGESTHFAIAVDHENPEIDRVVSEHERYAVVQKTLAMAVRIARETDPRR